ncbi:hypothetical protein [Streptomyces anulatus]|uniref:hypothetical protein n=1 Tax=Streptomyces anulatus TaxID=1892 RepID=UPI0032546450|nr:hypothetical protein OH791_32790 [Streptomyces anulatus]
MLETVVQIVTQVAGGTLTAVGTGVGQAVSDLVRERLGGSEAGRSAIQAIEARPTDQGAAAELRASLQAEMDADPEFTGRIAAVLAAGPPPAELPKVTSGSVTIDGSTVRGRNTISLGPVTINNTRNNRYSLLAAALVLVTLLALSLYGGVRLIAGDDAGQGKSVTPLSDADALHVLPDLASLPATWTQPEAPDIGGAQVPESAGLSYIASVDFLMGDSDADLLIRVAAFTSAQKAHAFHRKTEEAEGEPGGGFAGSLPRVGDESFAGSFPGTNGEAAGSAMSFRVGTVLILVRGEDTDGRPFNGTWLKGLATMMAERAQQAQNGQEPSASVRNT